MGEDTKIQWCDHTFNPWEGCTKVSAECDNCYAAARDHRIHNDEHWGKDALRMVHSASYWRQPAKWNKDAEGNNVRRRVFCGSLCDIMEDRRDLDRPRTHVYRLIEETPCLDWLLLTKRPQNFNRFFPNEWCAPNIGAPLTPPPNVWVMTTVGVPESQWRIAALLDTPNCAVYGLSCEPLLGKVVLPKRFLDLGSQAWVIAGGESGPCARESDVLGYSLDLMSQCKEAGVPFFMKQMGGAVNKRGNMNDFPTALQVRQFPVPSQT